MVRLLCELADHRVFNCGRWPTGCGRPTGGGRYTKISGIPAIKYGRLAIVLGRPAVKCAVDKIILIWQTDVEMWQTNGRTALKCGRPRLIIMQCGSLTVNCSRSTSNVAD